MSGASSNALMPCGHSWSMIVTEDEGTSYCRGCEDAAVSKRGTFLGGLRQRLGGWHFSQEALSKGEREILHVGEWVLREYDSLHAELDRLRGENVAVKAALTEPCAECGHIDWRSNGYLDPFIARAEAAEAENVRYRDALERIADPQNWTPSDGAPYQAARAALAGGEQEQTK